MASSGVFDTNTSLSEPPSALSLDTHALASYLQQKVPGSLQAGRAGQPISLHVRQFSHGQSNPTYLLEGPQLCRPLVLRKKPHGPILPSAHSIEREHQVLAALAKGAPGCRRVPVPRPVALCEDASVIGTPFYLMEFAKGKIFVDPNLSGMAPPTRAAIYHQMAEALAALHSTDVAAVGLQGYGNPRDYCQRQLKRWSAQYAASVAATPPPVAQLMEWLQAHVPAEDAIARPCICHGDYRLDNLVFEPQPQPPAELGSSYSRNQHSGGAGNQHSSGSSAGSEMPPQLVAVLDWELSTLGNRWADVAYNCLAYHLPPSMPVLRRLGAANGMLPPGIPNEQEYLRLYCQAAGVSPPAAADWAFYLALSLFRLLAILAGVQARSKQGNASSRVAAAVSSDSVLASLTEAAWGVIRAATSGAVPHTPTNTNTNTTNTTNTDRSSSSVAAGSSGVGGSKQGAAAPSSPPLDVGGPLPPRVAELQAKLKAFMAQHVYPAEEVFEAHAASDARWTVHPLMEQLKKKAKEARLWNLWLPGGLAAHLTHLVPLAASPLDQGVLLGAGLSNWEYAHLCQEMGRSIWAPEVFNCGAPDTGNMEVLAKYGSREQQVTWLLPLLQGDIRSCFAMTEKAVASSDATNIQASIQREGDQYVLRGLKWWTSGACDPRCAVAIFMGKTDTTAPQHLQQSMILVPFNAPGVRVVRPMLVFGYDDAPHGHAEVEFKDVRVPASNLILGEGRGFEIAQGRLGPGRLHHCMRLCGLAERALELAAKRALARKAFGGPLAAQGALQSELARCHVDWQGARLLVLHAAAAIDRVGNKRARGAVAAAKYAAPNMAQRVVDAAIQMHGGAGVSQDTVLARLYTAARTLRIADGPDEVHLGTIAKLELARAAKL